MIFITSFPIIFYIPSFYASPILSMTKWDAGKQWYNYVNTQNKVCLIISLCTLMLTVELAAQRDYEFELDTLYIHEVSAYNLTMADLSKLGAGSDQLCWPIKDSQRGNKILVFDSHSNSFHEVDVPENKCIDPNYTIRGLGVRDSTYFVWSNSGLIFNANTNGFECVDVPDITSGHFLVSGYLTFSNYYRDEMKPYAQLFGDSIDTRIEFEPDHFELTRFNPNNLIAASAFHLARLSVSKPIIYLYNHDFELVDSLQYASENWVDIETGFDADELEKLKGEKRDFFGYYFELFERGLSKNTNVQFLNDSTLVVGYIAGTCKHYYQVIFLDKTGRFDYVTEPKKVGNGLCFQAETEKLDRSVFQPLELVSKGIALDGYLYHAYFGTPTLPWGEPCEVLDELHNRPNPERLKWLHIFRFKLVEQ